jgi:hypothetical protein
LRFCGVHIGDPPPNQATTFESQQIQGIQYVFGQTLREKARGRRLRKEEIDPIITDLRRLTGWSEATVVDRLNLSKKKY